MHWSDVHDKLLKIRTSVYILDILCDARHVHDCCGRHSCLDTTANNNSKMTVESISLFHVHHSYVIRNTVALLFFSFLPLQYTFPQLSTPLEVVVPPVVPEILCSTHINVALNDIFVELLNRFLENI